MYPIIITLCSIICALPVSKSLDRLFAHKSRPFLKYLFYLVLSVSIGIPSWIGDENPILIFPFFILSFLVCLPDLFLKRLVLSSIFYSIIMPLNMVIDTALSGFWYVLALISKFLLFSLLNYIIYKKIPKEGLNLSKKLWAMFGFLSLAPLISMLSFSLWGYNSFGDIDYQTYHAVVDSIGYTSLPFITISSLSLLGSTVILSKHERLEEERNFSVLREVYYQGIKKEQANLRILSHDLNNHITILQSLLEQSNIQKAQEYLKSISDSKALNFEKNYCQNSVANIVLSSKTAKIEQHKLKSEFHISLPPKLELPDSELCAILSNALDNAIEGCDPLSDKKIILKLKLEKNIFMLKIENPINKPINEDFETTKKDKQSHGFGLKSMKAIALKHGGDLSIEKTSNTFTLLIYFPLKPSE